MDDVETAGESIIEQHRHSDSLPNGSHGQKASYVEFVDRTQQFKSQLNSLLLRHPFKDLVFGKPESSDQEIKMEDNGSHNVPRGDKTVLSVWSNVGRGRQLFSSLQKPSSGKEGVAASIDEALPDSVMTSKVIPYNPMSIETPKGRSRTLGEVFPPRSSLPMLEPPRKTDSSVRNSSVVDWLSPVDAVAITASELEDPKGYSSSNAPMVHWTNYGYELPNFPVRRETYQGSFQGGKQQSGHSQGRSKTESGLFREAYSSFAPSFDSSRSVVPRRTKSQVWWRRSGAKHMERLVSSGSTDVEVITAQIPEITLDHDGLEDAVNSFAPEPLEPAKTDEGSEDSEADEDIKPVLQEISELLRVLDSFRQLRQLGPGTSSIQEVDRFSMAEARANPSALELETYETLKASLSAMIATLPPHLVAKLDGDQLAGLNVSKKILLDNVDYPGTMEEDEYSVHQKQAAKVPQMVNPRAPNSSRTPPAVPYQRYPSRAKPPPTNYQVPQPYGPRSPAVHYPPNGLPQHSTPLQPAAHHPGYMQQPQYSQPGTPQPYPTTGASILQQFQRSSHNGNSPHLVQRGISPAQHHPQQYQQRQVPQNYQHPQTYRTPVPVPRSASPQKPVAYVQSPQRPYMSPSPNPPHQQQQQQQQQRFFQQPPQHAPQQAPPTGPHSGSYTNFPSNQASPMTQYSNAAAALAYSRSAAEQAALMERNRAQLADVPRPGSATPQSPHNPLPNGQPMPHGGHTGSQGPGTPGSTPNAA